MTQVYAAVADAYRASGWQGVLPVRGKKEGLPPGFTGRDGTWPGDDQVTFWKRSRGADNVCIRVPDTIIGIDVDAYDGRNGLQTLAHFESQFGPLPLTWRSTSRPRGEGSGIMWFRVPPGVRWVSDLGRDSNVEIVQWGHRYAVVWPSVHPDTGEVYRWYEPGGELSSRIPSLEELPELPQSWVDALTRSNQGARSARNGDHGDDAAWDGEQRVDPDRVLAGVPIGEQETELFRYICRMRARNYAKSEAVTLATQAVANMANQEGRAPWTGDDVREKVDRVWREYSPGTARTALERVNPELLEWAQSFGGRTPTNGTTVVATTGGDVPAEPSTPPETEAPRVTYESPPLDETATDTGNALRFARLLGDRVRYVTAEARWLIWSGDCWEPDDRNLALELTKVVIADLRAQGAAAEDDDERAQWLRWARDSESRARREAMLQLAASEPSLAVRADHLDADPDLLATRGGVTVNTRTGDTRPSRPEDLVTRVTTVAYDPSIDGSPLLDEFLATFMPDPANAEYVFRLLGQSLVGGNHFRLFVIIQGGTTSGKSMLVDAIAKTLGRYAVPIGTSVLRGNQDDKPRPDLLRALPARFAYAEEAGKAWELHCDQVKRLTGGALVSTRGMRSNLMVERAAQFTPVVVTNVMPRIRGADPAVRRRLRTLSFTRTPAQEDVSKKQRFVDDERTRQALLTLLIRGCVRAFREGVADTPPEFSDATMESFDALNHIGEFLTYMRDEDQLVESDDSPTYLCWKASDLHLAYKTWVNLHGDQEDRRTQLGLHDFGRTLRDLSGWTTVRSNGIRWAGKINPSQGQ